MRPYGSYYGTELVEGLVPWISGDQVSDYLVVDIVAFSF